MARTVALLRGINVGGNRLIKMSDLKACFESLGLKDVHTVIASGNVIFSGTTTDAKISAALKKEFGHDVPVTLRTAKQLRDVVKHAPKGFASAKHRCDVIFLFKGLTAAKAFKQLEFREGVDEGWAGKGVLYFRRLTAKASSSKLTKITQLPMYQQLTIRNWNTTNKLADLSGAD
ncbi:MAG: DUF1697 domain-containing protein [Archangium sp.]